MQSETLELDKRYGDEYAGRYVFSEITWAKRNRIIQKHTKYNPLIGQVEKSDFISIQAETIWASLREQPANKPLTLEKLLGEVNGIPIGLGELFSQITNKLNSLGIEEHGFLSGQYDDRNQIQSSRNSDSAKNSDGHPGNSKSNPQKPSNNSPSYSTS